MPAKQQYYKWIPTGLVKANDYRIKIVSSDYSTISDTSDNSFTITAAGSTGNMQLNTNPTAATIYMDDGLVSRVNSGATNKLFTALKAGDYLIEVTKDAYWPKRGLVTVVSGFTKTFVFTMIPLTDPSGNSNADIKLPRIDVNTDPVGAEIFIDGERIIADTPEGEPEIPILTPAQIEIAEGTYDVSVMLPDYKPAVVTGVPVPPYNDDPEADNIVIIDTFILIHKDQPTVTVADSQVTVGETATGTVTVSGVIGITPTGSMTFNLYGPSTTTDCTGYSRF